jgi:hypothetical protein
MVLQTKGIKPWQPVHCRTEGRNELRRQVGTLRFDINALADQLPKASKKEVLTAKVRHINMSVCLPCGQVFDVQHIAAQHLGQAHWS